MRVRKTNKRLFFKLHVNCMDSMEVHESLNSEFKEITISTATHVDLGGF